MAGFMVLTETGLVGGGPETMIGTCLAMSGNGSYEATYCRDRLADYRIVAELEVDEACDVGRFLQTDLAAYCVEVVTR